MSDGFVGLYSGQYEGVYSGDFVGVYSTAFSGTFSQGFEGTYSGTFSQGFEGTYSQGFEGFYSTGYLGEVLSSYTGGYTITYGSGGPGNEGPTYSGTYSEGHYIAAFSSTFSADYVGLYSGSFQGSYGGYLGLYSGGFEGAYEGNYTASYESVYSTSYEGYYSGQYEGAYSAAFLGNYSQGFTGAYQGNYSQGFVGSYTAAYEGSYEGNYSGYYSTSYEGTYSLNIGDTVVETTKTHHGKPETTVVHSSTGTVEVTTGGTSSISTSQSAGQPVITRIASNDTIVHLGIVDLENLTVNLKPKAVGEGEKAPGLGSNTQPFGDLYLQGNTLTLSTRSIGITESGGAEYLDFGSNTIIGATQITGDRLLAFADQLKITGLTDVSLAGLNDGNILKWSVSQNKWIPGTPSTIESLQLYQLEDVDTSGLLNGYVLKWNALESKWEVGSQDVATSVDLSTSDIGDLGNVTKIPYPHSSVFQYNTIESRWKAVAPDSITFEDLTSGTLTVNTEVVYSTTRTVQATAGEVVADSFSINTYRSAKYIITCEDYTTDNKGYWTGEIILAHDGTNTVLSVFGEVEIGDQSMNPSISADISSGNVRLKVTTSSDQQVVTSHRSVITKYT